MSDVATQIIITDPQAFRVAIILGALLVFVLGIASLAFIIWLSEYMRVRAIREYAYENDCKESIFSDMEKLESVLGDLSRDTNLKLFKSWYNSVIRFMTQLKHKWIE